MSPLHSTFVIDPHRIRTQQKILNFILNRSHRKDTTLKGRCIPCCATFYILCPPPDPKISSTHSCIRYPKFRIPMAQLTSRDPKPQHPCEAMRWMTLYRTSALYSRTRWFTVRARPCLHVHSVYAVETACTEYRRLGSGKDHYSNKASAQPGKGALLCVQDADCGAVYVTPDAVELAIPSIALHCTAQPASYVCTSSHNVSRTR
jgi:hypothetical protein